VQAFATNLCGGGRDAVLAAALDALAVHVAVLDVHGRIVTVNEAWRRFARANGVEGIEAWEGVDYLGGSCGNGTDPESDAARSTAGVRDVLAGRRDEFRFEYPCHSPDELRWFELRATRVPATSWTVVSHDLITERKLVQQQLEHMAHHDDLTGLPNRRQMFARLAEAQPTGRLGVILVDLDHFKQVNDVHGHAAGNEVLRATADALARPSGRGSVAGRHGGDEFCVALFDCDAQTLEAAGHEICARVRDRLARLGCAAPVTLSAGGTLVRPDEKLAAAIKRADEALYLVKGSGRDAFCAI